MKLRISLLAAFVALSSWAVLPARAAKPADDRPELALVVVDSLNPQSGAITDFDRLDMAMEKVAKRRGWPVKIKGERFAANTPDRDTELRVVLRRIQEESPGELAWRGWVTAKKAGRTHDYGIVLYRFHPRLGEQVTDTLEKLFLGAANTIADKVERDLFPDLKPAK